MMTKDVAQLIVSAVAPFIAAGAALAIAAASRKERASIVVSFGYDGNYDAIDYLVIHNRSLQTIAITSVRYYAGVIWRTPVDGTALDYDDPTDLDFPYVVEPGKLRRLRLDTGAAERIARRVGPLRRAVAWALRRSRFLVICRSTASATYRTSGEPILPWDDQLPWRRGK